MEGKDQQAAEAIQMTWIGPLIPEERKGKDRHIDGSEVSVHQCRRRQQALLPIQDTTHHQQHRHQQSHHHQQNSCSNEKCKTTHSSKQRQRQVRILGNILFGIWLAFHAILHPLYRHMTGSLAFDYFPVLTTACYGSGIWAGLLFMLLKCSNPGILPRGPAAARAPAPPSWPPGRGEEKEGEGPKRGKWCATCRLERPPRAKHCAVCGRCVARMDHHCVWLGRCVGRGNHRAFLRFLAAQGLHAALGAAVLARTVVQRQYENVHKELGPLNELLSSLQLLGSRFWLFTWNEKGLTMMIIVLLFPIFLVGGLLLGQLILISRNMLTNESINRHRYEEFKNGGNPYNVGFWRNWKAFHSETRIGAKVHPPRIKLFYKYFDESTQTALDSSESGFFIPSRDTTAGNRPEYQQQQSIPLMTSMVEERV